jgi:hypothetical protein
MADSIQRVLGFRTSTYARNIYLYGTQRLTARDGFTGVPVDYYIPVEQYAATTFSREQIDNAFAQGWLTEQEYNETVAYIV